MNRNRHTINLSFPVLAAAAILALMIVHPLRAEDKPEQIVIGFQVIPNGEIIAKDMKWQEETLGVPVKWVQIDSGRDMNTAMAAGSVDIGLVGTSPVATGIAQKIPYEVIWIHDVIGDNEALAARKGSGIEKVQDLAGKKVAAPFGSTTHYHLLTALALAHVKPGQVKILDMQPQAMLAAWQRGDIDAGFVWEPTLAKMVESGGKIVIASRQLAEQGYLTGDICAVRRDFAKKYPALVVKYLKNLVKAVEYYRSDPEKASECVARQFGIPQPEALRQMNTLIMLSGKEQLTKDYLGTASDKGKLAQVLKKSADFLVSQKLIKSAPGLPVFVGAINPSYIEEAVK